MGHLQLKPAGFRLNACVPAPDPFPECSIELDRNKRELPDFFKASGALIVSAKLRDVITTFDVPAEYVGMKVVRSEKVVAETGYYFLNLLDAVDCFDYGRSEYSPGPAGVTGIETLVIDESKCDGHHLFIVGPIGWAHSPNPKAIIGPFVCASEALATAALSAGITGAVFGLPEKHRDYPPEQWNA